jgi:hypothetical protein
MASKAIAKATAGASAEVKQQLEELQKQIDNIQAESDEARRRDIQKRYDEFRRKYFRYIEPDDEDVDDPDDKPPAPEKDGRPQPHKGANKDPATWKVVAMKDDPSLFKIVDDKDINVADLFHTKENAQAYIDRAKQGQPPKPDEPNPPTPEQPGPVTGETPYPPKSAKMPSTQRGPTERHYASGKASDNTIEKNVKEIEYQNYQAVVDITNDCEWSHDDTISIKLGGTHMGSGWFDNSLGVYTGKTGLGTEPDHPSTNLFIVKGPTIGDTRGKRFGLACTYFTKENKTELWTDFPKGSGWKKQVEGTNVGGFKPDSDVDEFQLRIDGFKERNKPPTIHDAFVTEI